MSDVKQYKEKRDFDASPEPSGEGNGDQRNNRFVIHRHDASNEHYDFRLAIDGVLKSWAVPKGPSTDPSDKRLMIRTEDHPLEYADFEGVIPEEEYGGGTVMIWDQGSFENITRKDGELVDAAQALESGELLVRLAGDKISGGYSLVRFRDEDDQWLLIKMDDDAADARRNPVSTETDSVQSGRSLEEIAEEEEPEKPLDES